MDYRSASAARLKAARRLTKRALRQRERAFLAEGPQAVSEALATGAHVTGLFVTAAAQARHAALVEAAAGGGIEVQVVSGEVMSELAQTVTPQGLLAVCDFVDVPLSAVTAARPKLVALLANVRDPGNAGTVLRTADAAGADAVVFADASVDPYNGKCVRASAGSLFHLPVVAGTRLPETIAALRGAGLRIIAADGRAGATLDDQEARDVLAAPTAWLFGNEAWGLPPELLEMADESVAVPIYGQAESLNLAAAAAVCMYASAAALRRPVPAPAPAPVPVPPALNSVAQGAKFVISNHPRVHHENVAGHYGYVALRGLMVSEIFEWRRVFDLQRREIPRAGLSLERFRALESDHIPSPASQNEPGPGHWMRPCRTEASQSWTTTPRAGERPARRSTLAARPPRPPAPSPRRAG